jgi:invasion protein IalB
MAMKVKWVLASTAAAAGLAGAIILLDQTIGPNLLKLADWGKLYAQTPAVGIGTTVAQAPSSPQQDTQAPSVPRRTETINYNSWTITCTDTVEKSSKKVCSGVLQVIEQKEKRVMFAWVIGRDNQGVLRTVMQTPTGVLIANGVELKLGKAPIRTIPYTACEPQRCQASMAMDDAMVKDAMASQEAVATIVAIDGRGINFNMPIKGIDKVFAAIGKS